MIFYFLGVFFLLFLGMIFWLKMVNFAAFVSQKYLILKD